MNGLSWVQAAGRAPLVRVVRARDYEPVMPATAIRIRVRPYADLGRFFPGDGRIRDVDVEPGATLRDLLAAHGLDDGRRLTLGVNDELATPDTRLSNGDVVDVLVPMSGGDEGDGLPGSIHDRILRIDLADGRIWTERLGREFFRKYLGGRNLIAYYLLTEVPDGIDAFDPENRLVFAMGPITGVALPGAGRHSVGAKSPLTGLFGESEAGGYWGAELKQAGWDAVVVQGRAQSPVYLWINDQEIEIRDASHLWGELTGPVEDQIREELGDPRIRVCQIGPAGENLVRFACVVNDLNEVAGRTGLGAVMGAKNLKAIAVRGSTRVTVADAEPIKATARWVGRETLGEGGEHHRLHNWGTGAAVKAKQLEGHLISHNFRDGRLDGSENIDAVAIKELVMDHMDRCFACSVRCKKRVRVETPHMKVEPRYGGPEYETLAAIGTNTGVTDIMAVCKGNEMLNYLGMDSISCGATIAWAMEMSELGLLTAAELQGETMRFGSAQDVLRIIDQIAHRQGVGDLLAEGSLRAARRLGKGSERYVVHVKGLEVAMHDPRAMRGMRDNYPISPTGGDHTGAGLKRTSVRNTVGLCQFLEYNDAKSLELLNAATGWDMSPEELHETFERGLTMARLFNLREGMTVEDDRLPDRLHEPLRLGPLKDYRLPKEEIRGYVSGYYEKHGWDAVEGKPYRDTIEYLGLNEIADALDDFDLTADRHEPVPVGAAPFVVELEGARGAAE